MNIICTEAILRFQPLPAYNAINLQKKGQKLSVCYCNLGDKFMGKDMAATVSV